MSCGGARRRERSPAAECADNRSSRSSSVDLNARTTRSCNRNRAHVRPDTDPLRPARSDPPALPTECGVDPATGWLGHAGERLEHARGTLGWYRERPSHAARRHSPRPPLHLGLEHGPGLPTTSLYHARLAPLHTVLHRSPSFTPAPTDRGLPYTHYSPPHRRTWNYLAPF
ncbi:unnamed protein product [Leptosia nina]|uniref:Uncharacterized protein n=1 Tax=Leptosia nina TaxID=320188 RepID=A0AAV1JBR7_9NEOP